jgi:hypothetical protein
VNLAKKNFPLDLFGITYTDITKLKILKLYSRNCIEISDWASLLLLMLLENTSYVLNSVDFSRVSWSEVQD